MSLFDDRLEEYLGDADSQSDIRAIVRRCWFYDIQGIPIRMWQGQGRLFTSDGNIWLGTVDAAGNDVHKTPRISDGRDGTALTYEFSLGYLDQETYEGIKADQNRIAERPLTCYLALFRLGGGLRPDTPIEFFKEFTMMSARFDETLDLVDTSLVRRYKVTVIAKDGNSGRSSTPSRTYTDTMQKEYARQLGVENDRGCEFIAGLANRTYKPD